MTTKKPRIYHGSANTVIKYVQTLDDHHDAMFFIKEWSYGNFDNIDEEFPDYAKFVADNETFQMPADQIVGELIKASKSTLITIEAMQQGETDIFGEFSEWSCEDAETVHIEWPNLAIVAHSLKDVIEAIDMMEKFSCNSSNSSPS